MKLSEVAYHRFIVFHPGELKEFTVDPSVFFPFIFQRFLHLATYFVFILFQDEFLRCYLCFIRVLVPCRLREPQVIYLGSHLFNLMLYLMKCIR